MAYLGAGITRFNTADELTVTGDAKIDTNTLVVDSTNNRVGILNASPATAFDVTGTITADDIVLSNDMTVADNGKVIFGAGSDLQIYHDGSNSFIDDAGTGNLQIRGTQIKLQKYTGENMFVGISDGAASMYYDNSQKIATSATGIGVTGHIDVNTSGNRAKLGYDSNNVYIGSTSGTGEIHFKNNIGSTDAPHSSGDTKMVITDTGVGIGAATPARLMELYNTTNPAIRLNNGNSNVDIGVASSAGALLSGAADDDLVIARNGAHGISIGTNGSTRLNIDNGGDISFYDDSGNAKLFWDASATSLEITGAETSRSNNTYAFKVDNSAQTSNTAAAGAMAVDVNSGRAFTITGQGNVGIGTSSPSFGIQTGNFRGTASAPSFSGTSGDGFAFDYYNGSNPYPRHGSIAVIGSGTATADLSFWTDSGSSVVERMRISSDGTIKQTAVSQGSSFAANTISTWNALEIFQDRGVTNSASGIAFRSQTGTAPAGIVSIVGNTTGGVENLAFITSTGNNSFERARITHDGHFVVGVTSTNAVTNGAGTYIAANGQLYASTNSAGGHYLNRTDSSNGVVLNIRHQGSTVGSIGTDGALNIGSTNTGIKFGTSAVWATTGGSTNSNGAKDLGASTVRWKDLYLSGGAYLGGTAAANKLDDYEEGTFSATWVGSGTSGPSSTMKYTKIGNTVHIFGNTGSTVPSPTGSIELSGLPFTPSEDSTGSILYRNVTALSGQHTLVAFIPSGTTNIQPYWSAQGTYVKLQSSQLNASGSQDMYFGVTYMTA